MPLTENYELAARPQLLIPTCELYSVSLINFETEFHYVALAFLELTL